MSQKTPANRNELYPVTTPEMRRRTTIEIAANGVRAHVPETLASADAMRNSVELVVTSEISETVEAPVEKIPGAMPADDDQTRMMHDALEQLAKIQGN